MSQLFDIVIAVGPNDTSVIKQQIDYTKKNVLGYRNIFLIAPSKICEYLADIPNCTIIDESIFPFSINMIHTIIGVNQTYRNGWYLQQLIKLYSGNTIPDILDRWLVIDADTFFLRPTTFVEDTTCLYAYGSERYIPYFDHMKRLLPILHRVQDRSGICHHMIFEKQYISELFTAVEDLHGQPFWKCFLTLISPSEYGGSGASEYEIYFNYMLIHNSDKIKVRSLSWGNVSELNVNSDCDYISYHHYSRR